jgi:DNA-binding IclR family transcriptional regulator
MKPVRTVDRALTILFAVARSDEPIGLSELGRTLSLDKATVLRLLATLEKFGLVQQNPSNKRYSIGPNVGSLVSSWRGDLRDVARPFLKALLRRTNETVCLVSPRGMERVYLDMLSGTHELSVIPAIGSAVPIHAGASGKVLLAYSPDEFVDEVISVSGLKPVNEVPGVTDPAKLRRLLREIRKQGYHFSVGDVVAGSAALAAPIFNAESQIVGCVVIRGPSVRLTREKLPELGPLARATADSVSHALGWAARPDAAPQLLASTAAERHAARPQ